MDSKRLQEIREAVQFATLPGMEGDTPLERRLFTMLSELLAEVERLRAEHAAMSEIVRAVAALDISAIDQDIYGWSGEIEIDGLIKQARALLASGDAHPQQEE